MARASLLAAGGGGGRDQGACERLEKVALYKAYKASDIVKHARGRC